MQACSDDAQVAFHAVHALAMTGVGLVRPRWSVDGFLGTGRGTESPTPRNLLGFKDGAVVDGTHREAIELGLEQLLVKVDHRPCVHPAAAMQLQFAA